MDSSSDDSFTWTKASSRDSSSESLNNSSAMNGDDGALSPGAELNNTTDKNLLSYNREECKEKKLKINSESVEFDSSNENFVINRKEECKLKKRKMKNESVECDSYDESPRKKRIKIEPTSDVETSKRKKKKKHSNIDDDADTSFTSNHNDDEYFNLRVKQEQNKSHDSVLDLNANSTDNEKCILHNDINHDKKSKKKKRKIDLDNNEENLNTMDVSSPKKKKNKVPKNLNTGESEIIEDKFTAEETIVQVHHSHNGTTNENCDDDHLDNNISDPDSNTIKSSQKTKNKTSRKISESGKVNNKLSSNNYPSGDETKLMESDDITSNKAEKSKPRILDRIRFEEDIDSDIEHLSQNTSETLSSKLKSFVKKNVSLQRVREMPSSSVISEDDEVWLLKYPHEVDINHLKNKELSIDNKSKIKINGETYVGNLEEECTKIAIMCSDKNNFIIKNFDLNGVITYKKRLPKPHFHEDNIMVNNQTDFIPLPDTKCRHPLFGSNYKTAIKIPASVAERLSDGLVTYTGEKKKKKKHKKEHNKDLEAQSEPVHQPKSEEESDIPRKKSKKRKYADDAERSVKKAKRIKLEKDSTEVWESEKAIEENLFNF